MKTIILFLIALFFSTGAYSQINLDENFDYPAGDSIGAHGWVWFSGVANTVLVTSPGLTYTDNPLSGIGNAATLTTNGNDQYKSFNSIIDSSNGNTAYASFMINVTSAQRPGDYVVAFLPSTSTSFFSGRVQIRLLGGGVEFGLTKASQPDTNTMVWSSGYSLNTTYTVVLKYKFISGPANDEVSLFVFSGGTIPATEPTATIGPMSFSATSNDANNIARIALRQGSSTRAPGVVIDGIRVSTTWYPVSLVFNAAIQGLISGFANITDTMSLYLRSTTTPYGIVDSCTAPLKFVNGAVDSGITFSFSNAPTGTYYIDAKYRHLPIYRNAIETWSKSGGEALSKFSWNTYDFTSSASQAFGGNQVTIGTENAFYNGDVNQDGIIDGSDASDVDNAAGNFLSGYLNVDLDGNDFVDGSDGAIADNNAFNFIGAVLPSP